MIYVLRNINCDWCSYAKKGVASIQEQADSDEEMRELAASVGWTRRLVANGSLWDFCPQCSREQEKT